MREKPNPDGRRDATQNQEFVSDDDRRQNHERHSLMTLIRPLRALHRALENWRGREEIVAAAQDCVRAIDADAHNDKLFRREFADRIRRLSVVGSLQILDALADDLVAPVLPKNYAAALSSAALIAAYSQFLD